MSVISAVARALARLHRRESGQTLVMFIGITIVFFAIAAIAVDGSLWQSQRRTAQKDADASALAAGQELLNRDGTIATRAQAAALQWVTRNGIDASYFQNGTPTVAGDSKSGCFGAPAFDGLPDSVTVDLQSRGTSFFTSIFGLLGANVGAHAKVCVGSIVDAEGVLPFGIPTDPTVNPNCFDASGAPLFGATCDIKVKEAGAGGETGTLTLYNGPDQGSGNQAECSDSTIDDGVNPATGKKWTQQDRFVAEVANGANTSCAIAPAGTNCSNQQYLQDNNTVSAVAPGIGVCIWSQTGAKPQWTLDGLYQRLGHEGQPAANPPDPGAFDCDALFPNAALGGMNNKVDQWWEALTPGGDVDITKITPGPNVIFLKRACTAPRLVTLILLNKFQDAGNCFGCPIVGFAGFFITGCKDTDNAGNVTFNQRCVTDQAKCAQTDVTCNPTGEPILQFSGQIELEGMFINYVTVGRRGGPLSKFAPPQLFLVE